jgi:hypothetical protein
MLTVCESMREAEKLKKKGENIRIELEKLIDKFLK